MSSRKVAIAGVGYTAFTKESGRSVLDQAVEACRAAADDAGVPLSEIDGVSSYSILGDSVPSAAVATSLALPGFRYVMDFNQGGQSPCYLVHLAAMAIAQGDADNVLIFRALNGRSGMRVGSGNFAAGAGQFRQPIGYNAWLMYMAMWARRYLEETGGSNDDLAAVALAQRKYAELNERAIQRKPLDADSYYASPWVAEPYRIADCTSEVDGACALLVSSLDRARDLRHPPAVVASTVFGSTPRPGIDIGDQLLYGDYTRNITWYLRDELYRRADISVDDVNFAELYDCFTSVVLMSLEGLGFCEYGEAGDFIRSGATAIDGRLPTNTHGGLLAEGYLHGMNTVAEAVLQLQGRGGNRQTPKHEVGVVTTGALVDGTAMVLTADR